MSVIKNPCTRDCSRRYPGCHSKCDDYKEFRQALDERNEIIYRERNRYYDTIDGILESRRQSIRRHKPSYKYKP